MKKMVVIVLMVCLLLPVLLRGQENQSRASQELMRMGMYIKKEGPRSQDVDLVHKLINLGTSKEARESFLRDCVSWRSKWTPLTKEKEEATASIVKLLLETDVNVNAPDANGKTALHLAAEGSRLQDSVKLLVKDKRTNVNAKDKEGKTPLMTPIRWSYWPADPAFFNITKILLDAKDIDVNIEDNNGKTAFVYLIESNHTAYTREVIGLLLLKDARIDGTDKNIQGLLALVLHASAMDDKKEIVERVLETGMDVNYKYEVALPEGRSLFTPFETIAGYGYGDLVQKNLKKANQYSKNQAIRFATENNYTDIVTLLLEEVDQNGKDEALIRAARRGSAEITKILLDAKADINAQDKWNDTALIKAVTQIGKQNDETRVNIFLDTIRVLVEFKVEGMPVLDLSITNQEGQTAMMIAQEIANPQIKEQVITLLEGTLGKN